MAEPTSWAILATVPWTATDGTVQPIGACIEKVWWDGVTPWKAPAGTQAVADTGQSVYQPVAAVPTTISALAFVQRFTSAEIAAINAADPVWAFEVAAAGTIETGNPMLLASMAAAVTAGLLTQARVTQVLNLSVTSP